MNSLRKQRCCLHNQIKLVNACKAFAINFVILCILFLLFMPSQKSDDYYLGEIAYGSTSGENDVHLVYNHIFLGYLIKGLAGIFPNIAWYTVLQVVFVLGAFTALTYYFLTSGSYANLFLADIFLKFFFGYECYTKITFTKTGFVLISTGIFFLLKAVFETKQTWTHAVGIVQITLGILYRRAAVSSVLGLMIGICIIEVLAAWKEKRLNVNKIIMIMLPITAVLCVSQIFGSLNTYLYSLDDDWNRYYDQNSRKSAVVDYTIYDYEQHANEYAALGISENDLTMIYNNDLYDPEILTEDMLEEIGNIAKQDKQSGLLMEVFRLENMRAFMREIPVTYIKRFGFGCFLILSMIFYLSVSGSKMFCLLLIMALMTAENYYLFLKGRVLQPYIDAGIIYASCLFLIYFMSGEKRERISMQRMTVRGMIPAIALAFILYLSYSVSLLTGPFFDYGGSHATSPQKSKRIMDVITADKDHLYLLPSRESVYLKWCFDTFEYIPKNYFQNVFCMGTYLWPCHTEALNRYQVTNPLKEMLDADHIYFLVSDDIEGYFTNIFLTYVQEHYDEDAKLDKVKEVGYANVYMCYAGELQLPKLAEGSGPVEHDLGYYIEDSNLMVEGYAFVNNSNSYEQDCYIEIIDTETDEVHYYTATKREYRCFDDIYHGKYSNIYANIAMPESLGEFNRMNFILTADDKIYRIPLSKRRGGE